MVSPYGWVYVDSCIERGTEDDRERYLRGNYFETNQEACKVRRKIEDESKIAKI